MKSIITRDRLILVALFVFTLAVYARSLAPSITWKNDAADSGDLVTAAFTGGIPHPTGYPLYTIIAAGFARLPFGEPAQGVALFSALAAAAAVVLIYFAARALMPADTRAEVSIIASVCAALALAFAPLFWQQANVAELYALNALFVAALLVVLLSENPHKLELAAGIFGLGLAHHLSILFFAPTALLLLTVKPWSRREMLCAVAFLIAPLLLYLYLPLRASANPPVNWGDPSTLAGFWWTISATPYRAYFFDFQIPDLPARLGMPARYLFQQFGIWGAALGLWGIVQMFQGGARHTSSALALAFVLAVAYAVVYNSRNSYVYLLPAFVLFALWIAHGLADVARMLSLKWARVLVVAALVVMPGFNLVANFSPMDLSRDREAFDYAASAFRTMPRDAVVVTDGDQRLFALWYYRYVIARDDSRVVVVSRELLQYDWYYDAIQKAMPALLDKSYLPTYRLRVQQVVDQNRRDGRAVYSTIQGDVLAQWVMQSEGVLFQITGRQQ
jgi:hypothetical protein